MANSDLDTLTQYLAKLPGLGPRSARRAVLHLLTKGRGILQPMAKELVHLDETITSCEICKNLDIISPCGICTDEKRDKATLCVVEDVADLWALEKSNLFRGVYFVLGGTLSAVDGLGPEELGINKLAGKVRDEGIKEVIIATNATVEGQTTAHYITECLEGTEIRITRLAHGIPIGGELDYLDEGTLNAALNSRQLV